MSIVEYPAALPGPQPGSFDPRPRRAASSIDGPLQQRARQRDAAGMTSQYTYVYTPAQMDEWRNWWRDTLLDGKRWFAHDLPGPGGLTPRVVRYRDVHQQLLGNGIYRVSASFEQRGSALAPVLEGDAYWSNVILLLEGDNIATPSVFLDSGPDNRSVSVVRGSPTQSSGTKKLGSGAIYAASTFGLQYDVPAIPGEPSNSKFTLDLWYMRDASQNYIAFCWGVSTVMFLRTPANSGSYEPAIGDPNLFLVAHGAPLGTSTWYHLEYSFESISSTQGIWRIFVDGVKKAESVGVSPTFAAGGTLDFGRSDLAGFSGLGGYVDMYRLTYGVVRHVDDFTPPSTARDYLPA